MSVKEEGKSQRLDKGLTEEAKVISDLRDKGYNIEKATFQEDVDAGIDAYIEDEDGIKRSVQIKVRDKNLNTGGDDVIFEVYKNIAVRKIGRDYVGESEFTICRVKDGSIVKIPTKVMKDLTNEHMDERDIEPERYEHHEFRIFPAGGGESGMKFAGFFSPDICEVL